MIVALRPSRSNSAWAVRIASVVLAAVGAAAFAGGARAQDIHSANAALAAELDLGAGATEIAFWKDTAVVGLRDADGPEGDGFAVVDISRPLAPQLISRFRCTATHRDISIWEDLVILSTWYQGTDGSGCDADPAAIGDPNAFTGIRIVSIRDPRKPRLVGSVATGCNGSHTHTLLPDLDNRDAQNRPAPRLVIWASPEFYGSGSEPQTGEGCQRIIEVPLKDPAASGVTGTVPVSALYGCHDVTMFQPRRLAVAACLFDVRLFDVSDPLRPVPLSRFSNPFIFNHHGAALSWDGHTLAIGDEANNHINSPVPTCPAGTGAPTGAIWFYDISDLGDPRPAGWYQIPREPRAGPEKGCTAHYFNVVPLPEGRDVLSAAWYAAGLTLVDFTDPGDPQELAFYQRSPQDLARRSNYYSAYFYNGFVYATNVGPRAEAGFPSTDRTTLDVIAVADPALAGALRLDHLNAQTQEPLPAGHAPTKPRTGPAANDKAKAKKNRARQRRNARRACSRAARSVTRRLRGTARRRAFTRRYAACMRRGSRR